MKMAGDLDVKIDEIVEHHKPTILKLGEFLNENKSQRFNYHIRQNNYYYQKAKKYSERHCDPNTKSISVFETEFEEKFIDRFANQIQQVAQKKMDEEESAQVLNIFELGQLEQFKQMVTDFTKKNQEEEDQNKQKTVQAYKNFKNRSKKILTLLVKATKNIYKKNLEAEVESLEFAKNMRQKRKMEMQRKKIEREQQALKERQEQALREKLEKAKEGNQDK